MAHASKTRRGLKVFFLFITMIAGSCDTFEDDASPADDPAGLTQHDFYVLPNSSAVIDIQSIVRSEDAVTVSVISAPEKGELSKLGTSLLKYKPTADFTNGIDQFIMSFARKGKVFRTETVYINVSQDTTEFPCQLTAVEDFATAATNTPVIISYLDNDFFCGADKSSILKSIYSNPGHGQATLTDTVIFYTPAAGYRGWDQFVYKLSIPQDTIQSFGLVSVWVDSDTCSIKLNNDLASFSVKTGELPVFETNVLTNDQLCVADSAANSISIVSAPQYGTATISADGIVRYTKSSPYTQSYSDSLGYRICYRGNCYVARMTLSFNVKTDTCSLEAITDNVIVSDTTSAPVWISVLNNDQLCGGVDTVSIISGPYHGTVQAVSVPWSYTPDVNMVRDSIQYEICNNSNLCSRAWVLIRKE